MTISKDTGGAVARHSDDSGQPWDFALFGAEWLGHRERQQTRVVLALSALVHLFSLGVVLQVAHPLTVPWLMGLHGGLLLVIAAGWIRGTPAAARAALRLIVAGVILGYVALNAWVGRNLPSPRDVLLAASTLTVFAAFGLLLVPARPLPLALATVAVILLAGAALWPVSGAVAWTLVFAMTLLFALGVRAMHDRRLTQLARREFEFATLMVPQHIVRYAVRGGADLESMFRPKSQYCVCLAANWRDYQALATRLNPSQLSMTLNEFYDLCHHLLQRHLPLGNYYADWIADELSVVVFPVAAEDPSYLVEAALRFAREFVAARAEFARIHGLPGALDVGLSAGEALVGLMGPTRQRKATALGAVPGRARRFQSTGSLLRRKFGDRDRVIFDQELLLRIRSAYDVRQLVLAENESVRDLADRELFYLEPEPAERLVAPRAA